MLVAAAGLVTGAAVSAAGGVPIDIPQRLQGAQVVVVATARSVTPMWRTTPEGDQVIVSRVLLEVAETLKGMAQTSEMLEVEGGTLGGFTLRVSDLPSLAPGEQAVFFLDRTGTSSEFVPHLRGLGILKLDPDGTVQGSSLRLADIRRMAQAAR
jgi:hypothetical protein